MHRATHTAARPVQLPRQPTMSNAEYAASRHTVWLSATAVITDPFGRVLVVEPTYRDTLLLPGGGIEAGETPAEGCRREIAEETGLGLEPGRVLAVDHVSPAIEGIPDDLPFPGDIHIVFDGGTVPEETAGRLRLPADELAGARFLPAGEAATRMARAEGRRLLAALRARWGQPGPVYLQDGRHIGPLPALERHAVLSRPRACAAWPWRPGAELPTALPHVASSGWLFAPDGRVLLTVDPAERLVVLPGGPLDRCDGGDPGAALVRTAAEGAAATIADPRVLGHVRDVTGAHHGLGPCARVRMAARVLGIGAAAPDQATGHTRPRLLATPAQAAALLGWGPSATAQAEAASAVAAERWGIPAAPASAVSEVPAAGLSW
ncbi:NUDIX domain-containing protein [Streptomyces avicenniae]|uniref:NUDIX domain-containing protein n=1 Tax=Streptomyces avicenniae TaxID=500153 RepID=UPI00069B2465|nr:NUDIX hydrolase [Streptomyces avicenniae]